MCSLFEFSIQQFFICLFRCKKLFVCKFQHFPRGIFIFFKCSTPHVGIRFYRHVPNSTKNKNLKFLNPYLLQKMVFLVSKTLLSPSNPMSNSLVI
jgi:hypothetical protein